MKTNRCPRWWRRRLFVFGGIFREAYLDIVPRVYRKRLYIDTAIDGMSIFGPISSTN
jgi:uncharacterized membrane protein YeiH